MRPILSATDTSRGQPQLRPGQVPWRNAKTAIHQSRYDPLNFSFAEKISDMTVKLTSWFSYNVYLLFTNVPLDETKPHLLIIGLMEHTI